MKIGLPKEIKDNEYRVGLTPAGVHALVNAGHTVFVQKTAGEGSGFTDEQYVKAGGQLLDTADEVWATGDMIVKVKEPVAPEYPRMSENQLLFTYLHLAPELELTKQMMERKVTGVAYETITDTNGRLPLLTPMSEVAGRMSVQVGATYLRKDEWWPRHFAGRRARSSGRQTSSLSAEVSSVPRQRRWPSASGQR
jgi:alanine dehydrogenase